MRSPYVKAFFGTGQVNFQILLISEENGEPPFASFAISDMNYAANLPGIQRRKYLWEMMRPTSSPIANAAKSGTAYRYYFFSKGNRPNSAL